jgi:serine O-acetyltransferase
VGVPGRVVKRNNQALPQEDMDQISLPDPVKEDLLNLQHANSELTNRLLELENQIKQLRKK